MRVFPNSSLKLLLLVLLFAITATEADVEPDDAISSSAASASDINIKNDNNNLEDEVMLETIATGRGDRDEVGHREEWSKQEHLRESSRFDTRKGQPISSQIKKKLQFYRLECNECDNNEAVAKINAFVLDTKRQAEVKAQRQSWMSAVIQAVVGAALCALAYFFYQDGTINKGSYTLGGGSSGGSGSDDNRRTQIEDQRRRAAARLEEEILTLQRANDNAPTWVDNEMTEIWTPKQEKQFANALVMYGRMSAKTRYKLVADNVDDKTKQECLMHHKLQQLIAKEQ